MCRYVYVVCCDFLNGKKMIKKQKTPKTEINAKYGHYNVPENSDYYGAGQRFFGHLATITDDSEFVKNNKKQ